jgi:hypothetical protein
VAQACNPSYFGGWDQYDHGLRTAWANSSWDPMSKITRAKWTGGVGQAVQHLLWQVWSPVSNSSPTTTHTHTHTHTHTQTKLKKKKKLRKCFLRRGVSLPLMTTCPASPEPYPYALRWRTWIIERNLRGLESTESREAGAGQAALSPRDLFTHCISQPTCHADRGGRSAAEEGIR